MLIGCETKLCPIYVPAVIVYRALIVLLYLWAHRLFEGLCGFVRVWIFAITQYLPVFDSWTYSDSTCVDSCASRREIGYGCTLRLRRSSSRRHPHGRGGQQVAMVQGEYAPVFVLDCTVRKHVEIMNQSGPIRYWKKGGWDAFNPTWSWSTHWIMKSGLGFGIHRACLS